MAAYTSPDVNALLIGGAGQEQISELLANEGPRVGLAEIQKRAGLSHPLCRPLLGMVDQMGISRFEAHKAILQAAKKSLLHRVHSLDPVTDKVKLERLLGSSFIYLGLPELREVPLAAMEKLENVPANWLKDLAADKQVFKDLPARVQRQVWEFDKNLLQLDVLPLVGQFQFEQVTLQQNLAFDAFLRPSAGEKGTGTAPAGGVSPSAANRVSGSAGQKAGALTGAPGCGASRPLSMAKNAKSPNDVHALGKGTVAADSSNAEKSLGVVRKMLRKKSRITQELKELVGSSLKIYQQLVELCLVKFCDASDEAAANGGGGGGGPAASSFCMLRSQLLMALHDDSNPIAKKDKCHGLAWTIDAGVLAGSLSDKHLEHLRSCFDSICPTPMGEHDDLRRRRQAPGGFGRDVLLQDEAEAAGSHSRSLLGTLGDAGVVLRDPAATHLLLGKALSLMRECATEFQLPRQSAELVFTLRLLQIAADCGQMLRSREYRFPEVDLVLLKDLLPLLVEQMHDFMMEGGGVVPGGAAKGGALQGSAAAHAGVAGVSGSKLRLGGGGGSSQADLAYPDMETRNRVLALLRRAEAARRLLQAFAMERLAAGHGAAAGKALKLIGETLSDAAESAAGPPPETLLLEMVDFLCTLARRLTEMARVGALELSSSVWIHGVDHVLVRALEIGAYPQVREEILKLLLAAASTPPASATAAAAAAVSPIAAMAGAKETVGPLLPPLTLQPYLDAALGRDRAGSRRSLHPPPRRGQAGDADPSAPGPFSGDDSNPYYGGSRAGGEGPADGPAAVASVGRQGAVRGDPGLRAVLEAFRRLPGVNSCSVPVLFDTSGGLPGV